MIVDLPDLIAKKAALTPDRIALEKVRGGGVCTYAELDRRAGKAAALLEACGVLEGDRVAFLGRNRTEFFELLFACAKAGAILVPLNWRMAGRELSGLVADCDPAILFHGEEEALLAAQVDRPRIAFGEEYEARLAALAPRPGRRFWPAEASWYLLYTSGTTGRPKGVINSFRMALANHVSLSAATGLGSGDTTLCFLPLFHTAGINLHALPTLIAGGRVLLLDSFDAEAVVTLIEQKRLDLFFAVPTVYRSLLAHPRFAAAPLQAVRHWGSGGAPLPDALAVSYRELGVRLCNGMGMTETGPTAFLLDPADAWDHLGSVGKPQLLCSVRIVDGEGRDVADGEVGDLLFAGPGITPGYWRDEAATRAAFTEDGWLRSGDLARRDAQGFYHVVGRRKEMFISGGENVFPIEVENVLRAHPAVADAAVVGAPDEHWGEVGLAFVQPAAGAAADPEALSHFCRERLAAYKVPKHFRLVPEFPRTSAGKIQKHLLAPDPVPGA